MATAVDFTFMEQLFNFTSVMDFRWLISLIIIFITLIIITRDVNKWGTLGLPVTIGWKIAGLKISVLWMIVSIVWFVISIMSIETIGQILGTSRRNKKELKSMELNSQKRVYRSLYEKELRPMKLFNMESKKYEEVGGTGATLESLRKSVLRGRR